MTPTKHNWTTEELLAIYNTPFLELLYQASTVHRANHTAYEVQVSSLLSIKTGGCPEDCSYCPQAARYNTHIDVHKLMTHDAVMQAADNAKTGGSSRMCLGAAWREVRNNSDFERVLDMVKGINEKGMEVCCTLGMLTDEQANKLANAGLYAYNHNIDTSKENYNNIISTRNYEDRLNTINNVRKAGITVCSGGIIGMGETSIDRVNMLKTLANLPVHPESVPINALVPVEGTPMAEQPQVPSWDMIRMVATARIVLPQTAVRLSAGRMQLNQEAQAMCFLAGANSIFAGDKLLTTPNPEFDTDKQMFATLGITPKAAFADKAKKFNHPVETI